MAVHIGSSSSYQQQQQSATGLHLQAIFQQQEMILGCHDITGAGAFAETAFLYSEGSSNCWRPSCFQSYFDSAKSFPNCMHDTVSVTDDVPTSSATTLGTTALPTASLYPRSARMTLCFVNIKIVARLFLRGGLFVVH